MKKYFIGTSGWDYPHWEGKFYPKEIKKKNWFAYFSEKFDSVEINYSFYNWPKKETLKKWKNNAPGNFHYTMKAPRLITHLKKLKNVEKLVKDFYELTSCLGSKMGCHLFQLPANFVYNENNLKKLKKFLKILDRRKDNAIEFRDRNWWKKEIYELLEKEGVGFVSVDGLGMPKDFVVCGKLVYLRLHGKHYSGSYTKKQLKDYSEKLKKQKCDKIYVYFNNDIDANAAKNALELKKMIK